MKTIADTNITLIIPVYNVENYLEQCLGSVVSQSVPFDEVILINDGSTDHSLEICRKYTSAYNYFKLINQENKGQSSARNIGLRYASGDYIMFLDSDDYLASDTVKEMKGQLKKEAYDAVYFDAEIHCEEPCKLSVRNAYDRSNAKLDGAVMNGWDFFTKCYPRNYVVSVCMAVYKKSVIIDKNINFPEGLYYEDNYFAFLYLKHAEKVIHISKKLYQRRFRENSTTISAFTEKKFIDYIKVSLLILDTVRIDMDKRSNRLKELNLAFISDYLIIVLKNYKACINEKIRLGAEAKKSFINIVKNYFDFLDALCIDIVKFDLSILFRILNIFHYLDYWGFIDRDDLKLQMQEIADTLKIRYISLLKEIPFNKAEYKIGIYGTGKHTEGLLSIYEKLIGQVVCKIVFVDSQKDDQVYRGRNVINYRKVREQYLDLIIISSFIYEQEMVKKLMEISSNYPIYTFYEGLNGDIFSDYKVFLEYC